MMDDIHMFTDQATTQSLPQQHIEQVKNIKALQTLKFLFSRNYTHKRIFLIT